jgi:hypothetical protein
MDNETRQKVRDFIAAAKAPIPELEKDIADAKRAGLQDLVKADEDRLRDLKTQIAAMEKVYGGSPR